MNCISYVFRPKSTAHKNALKVTMRMTALVACKLSESECVVSKLLIESQCRQDTKDTS